MSNIFGNLLDLVDCIYSLEGQDRNFGNVVDVKIERLHGLDRLSTKKMGMFPEVSIAGNNFEYFNRISRSISANLDWLLAKQSELNSFAETNNPKFIRNCFYGVYVSSIETPLSYDEETDCYKISFFTYTSGEVIKTKTRERITIFIAPLDEDKKEIIVPETKEGEVREENVEDLTTDKGFDDMLGSLFKTEKEEDGL